MRKLYILLTIFTLSSSITFANYKVDSIGVENNKGKKLIVHRVEAKETYYSLAKKYNVNFKDIMSFNDSKFLQIGVTIKVPTEIPFSSATSSTVATSNSEDVVQYTIKAKDNLNMLAEKYGTTVDEIKRVNGLKSINLQIGQVLIIPNERKVEDTATQPETKTLVTPPTPKTAVDNKVATNENPATVVEHAIKAKENLNLLAEKYGTTVDEIKRLNVLSSNNLRIGQVLKIPSVNGTQAPVVENVTPTEPKSNAKKEVVVAKTNAADAGFEHTVVAGETIYSIAQKYSLTTYQLKTFNNLTSTDVVVGQKLIIKGAKLAATEGDDEESTGSPNTIKDPTLKYAPSKYGLTQFEEKGIAVWIADQDLDATKMLVLHRTAPVGTVIKITNPMSNRTTYAKVVGKFTENESTKDVIIVMTKAVADAVGALDKRFTCNITYGAPENEQQK
ncbi:LysM peptidoglycan-binding domain-containing protein [Pedobacter frigiditerrae]|uniref:LysM peptidoglycan-binding domain-containing protein n=1 Tax=Pedobacter frigiditerrae TaxID=2530452 RepID=A0A4R0MX61_9SPHI|nr:LysM peptidoglycan-binding domain-containing protein [Pedobacter frigiditerrae]TCC91810.1 LysM peptidoglycan-binding domain-containing protein [Pedobacter frigiditerrae]